jgi:capsule polysaccharide modification protein KpsS
MEAAVSPNIGIGSKTTYQIPKDYLIHHHENLRCLVPHADKQWFYYLYVGIHVKCFVLDSEHQAHYMLWYGKLWPFSVIFNIYMEEKHLLTLGIQ